MRRGFTLLELCYVLAIIAALTALAIPAYDSVLRRVWAAEPRGLTPAIAQAELRYFRDHGAYLECPASGVIPARTAVFPKDEACWHALGIGITGAVRYRYSVALTGGAYVVTAEGDLDQDGVLGRYDLDGATLALSVADELE